MQCKNHPQLAAKDRCAGCAETFCENCLVTVHGRSYCGACKVMALRSRGPAVVETRTRVCPEAREALVLAVVATFCCCWAPFVAPWAIVKAYKAKQVLSERPQLMGKTMATIAMVIAGVELVVCATLLLVFLVGYARQ